MQRSRSTKSLDHVLSALADPKRRAILKRLARGEARVTELARPFSVSLNSISKHIKLLERAGLVVRRKVGREHILRFRPEPLSKIQNWISKQEAFWKSSLQALDDLLQDENDSREQKK